MKRMACTEAWTTMTAHFVFSASTPLCEKSRGLAQHLNLLLQLLVVTAKLRLPGGSGHDRRCRARSRQFKPPRLQRRRRDAEFRGNAAVCRDRRRKRCCWPLPVTGLNTLDGRQDLSVELKIGCRYGGAHKAGALFWQVPRGVEIFDIPILDGCYTCTAITCPASAIDRYAIGLSKFEK